jgi:dimethylamine/trimethylamine dehydrogenase
MRMGLLMEALLVISPRVFPDYATALRLCYEEELSGEGYFAGLAGQFTGRPRDALLLMARMERVTAAALRAPLARHRIAAADDAALIARGAAEASAQAGIAWEALTRRMAEDYPAYLEEFGQLLRLAPAADAAPAALALEHERVLIDFAHREIAGDPASLAPLEAFLARHETGWLA